MSAPVFRDYDQAGLDAQYNNRAKVPDFERHLARWSEQGVHARARLSPRLEVSYDPLGTQTLNVFPAAPAAAPAPVLVFFHGGYWMALSKASTDCIALGFVPHGVAVVNVGYSLMPGVRMDEVVRQARAAVAWTLAHAASFGGDPTRVWVAGHSAGGHLATAAAATDPARWVEAGAAPGTVPAGGFAFSGLHELEPVRRSYLNATLGLDEAEAARNSPRFMAPPASGDWQLLVGGEEGPEYLRQSVGLAATWGSDAHRRVRLEVLRGEDHFSLMAPLSDPGSVLVQRMRADMR